jgi:hypothetical protein
MPTIDELKNEAPIPEQNFSTDEEISQVLQPEPSKLNGIFNKILTAETGEGSIGDYIEHPMNFNNSKGLARILRGLTGIIGNLSLAIIDIGLGVLEFSKENKGVVKEDVPIGPNGSFYPS